MKKVTIKAADTKPENDKAKKLYRVALDIIRRLDEIVKQKKALKEVFQPEATNLRARLQDYCERLLFYDPTEYGRKAEELLWRKVYYDVIQLIKHNKKQVQSFPAVESAFKTHLCSATGYYHHLLFKLQCEYSLKLEGIVDVFHVPEPRNHKKSALWGKRVEPEAHVRDWAIKACHRCLVYLGDIARYRQEYDDQRSCLVAQRYYHQALFLCPELGMPHNQLGTLAGSRCYNLDAIYHYLRCMVSPSSFEGAEGNLIRLFERNSRRYSELAYLLPQGEIPPDQRRCKDIRRFIVRFLHLCDVFVSPHQGSTQYSAKELQDLCQGTLNDFNLCMFYQPTSWVELSANSSSGVQTREDKPLYLDVELIFKVAVLSMICIHMQRTTSREQIVAATAFSLALFSHVLNHVVIRLQSALYELENPRKVLELPSEEEKRTTSTDCDDAEEAKGKGKNKEPKKEDLPSPLEKSQGHVNNEKEEAKRRRKVRKLKAARRRRRCGSDSSTASDNSHLASHDSDLSEGALSLSGSGTELNYLNHSDSSGSDIENIMASQEMRSGFSGAVESTSCESIQGDGTSLSRNDADNDGSAEVNGMEKPKTKILSKKSNQQSGNEAKHNGDPVTEHTTSEAVMGSDHERSLNLSLNHFESDDPPLSPGLPNHTEKAHNRDSTNNNHKHHTSEFLAADLDKIADVSQYLQEFPVDWLSDSSNIFHQTLECASLLNGSCTGGDISSGATALEEIQEITDVVQGKKKVRVPPGFEHSKESLAVQEITDKLTNFNIETDTEAYFNTDTEANMTTESELETETETEVESVVDRTECEHQKLQRLLNVVTEEGLLSTIKIYCDWLRCNPHVMVTCAKSSLSLWSRLSVLLNFLPPENEIYKAGLCSEEELQSILLQACAGSGLLPDRASLPLSEDLHLRCFSPLAETHANLDFSAHVLATAPHLSTQHEVLLRVSVLRQFGLFLSGIESIPLNYDKEKNLFLGPAPTRMPDQTGNDNEAQQQLADKQARRNQLMKDMAQLRLKAEVSQLEGSLGQNAQRPTLPPYLVPDASVLCDNLGLIRQLAHSGRFIVIIPIAVIDQLDVLKKESVGAREAIRWLEAEFKKGNRYVRAQKQHEKTTKFPHKNMKKKDKDAWRYVLIVDCAKYLSQQSPESESSSHSMVCVLSNYKINSPDISIRVKQVLANAQQQGLALSSAVEFHANWKETTKTQNNG